MIATVKAYLNTGLQINNSLDDINQLDALGFSSRSFPNIAIKQDRGRISIRINASYENIKDADYIKINDVGYWVTGINMLNDNVAEVGLQQDFVTTVGVSGLEVVSGWCTRRHVLDDTVYSNTLDEPFAPTNPLKIDFGNEITGSGAAGTSRVIIVSSIDLTNVSDLEAKSYEDLDEDKVLVPQLPTCSDSHTIYVSHIVGTNQSRVPMTQAYAGGDSIILKALGTVRSLGVESCIVACYNLPGEWASGTASGSLYSQLTDNSQNVNSAFSMSWGNYKNKKVYSGQFQKILVYSLASGDYSENRVEDIINPDSNLITWFVAADPRFNGNPVCRPLYYHSTLNNKLMSTVNGAKWQQTPITYQGASGYGFLQENLRTQVEKMNTQRLYGVLGSLSGMLGGSTAPQNIYQTQGANGGFNGFYDASHGFGDAGARWGGQLNPLGLAGSFLGGVASIGSMNANIMYNKRELFNSYSQAMTTLDVEFPRIPSFQDYVGNNFYEMRYRLSDNDMTRFDNFLTQFGYAVDEVLKLECFSGRKHFNYVQGRDVALKKSGVPQYLLEGMSKVIESGVRIWHTAPAHSKLLDNPIA